MSHHNEGKYFWLLLSASVIALGLAAAPAAFAASDDEYVEDEATADTTVVADDEIVVTAPRARRGEYGAPIRNVAMSRDVSFADLDLTTNDGARALEARIRSTARNLCRQLEVMHPVATDDSPPCYETAVDDAMIQATAAIADARDVASDESEE